MESLESTREGTLEPSGSRQTVAIGGGKGGVGKSLVTIGLAHCLGRLNKQVILMDADLGGANLHTMLGIRIPEATLEDFMLRRVGNLEDVLLKTQLPNVRLIAGGMEMPSLGNPNYGQKTRLLRALARLSADFLLVDLGAGASATVLDLFLACPGKIAVMTAQPTSIQNAYTFIKAALYRKVSRILRKTTLQGLLDETTHREDRPIPPSVEAILEEVSRVTPDLVPQVREAIDSFHLHLVLNMMRKQSEQRASSVIQEVARQYLGIRITCIGLIPYDQTLERWAAQMSRGAFALEGSGGALHATHEIAYRLLGGDQRQRSAAA